MRGGSRRCGGCTVAAWTGPGHNFSRKIRAAMSAARKQLTDYRLRTGDCQSHELQCDIVELLATNDRVFAPDQVQK